METKGQRNANFDSKCHQHFRLVPRRVSSSGEIYRPITFTYRVSVATGEFPISVWCPYLSQYFSPKMSLDFFQFSWLIYYAGDGLGYELWLEFSSYTEIGSRDLSPNMYYGRIPTRTGKPGKMGRLFPVREKSGNFEQTGKVRENHTKYWKTQGIWDKYYLIFLYIILVIFKWTVYRLLKWIKFSVKKTKH